MVRFADKRRRGRGGQFLLAMDTIRALVQREPLTPAELGRQLGVSKRTAYRALDALRRAGAPLRVAVRPRRYWMSKADAWRWMMER